MPFRVKCPTCRVETDWENNPYRPFCSERCRFIDLGAWFDERYRVPTSDSEAPPDDEDDGGSEQGLR